MVKSEICVSRADDILSYIVLAVINQGAKSFPINRTLSVKAPGKQYVNDHVDFRQAVTLIPPGPF